MTRPKTQVGNKGMKECRIFSYFLVFDVLTRNHHVLFLKLAQIADSEKNATENPLFFACEALFLYVIRVKKSIFDLFEKICQESDACQLVGMKGKEYG